VIEGRLYFTHSARAIPARLVPLDGGPVLRVEGRPDVPSPAILSVSDPLGRLPRKIHFADGSIFEATADADLSMLGGRRGGLQGVVARVERHWPSIALSCVAAALAVVAIVRWGVPAGASGMAMVTPAPLMVAIDEATGATIDRTMAKPSRLPQDRQAAIRREFGLLVARSTLSATPPVLLFRDIPSVGPNAFALPGGSILLTDELVALARSDDELLGVLAHELGHAEGRHGLRQVYAAAALYVAAGFVAGDPSGLVQAVAGQGALLQSLSYSRDFEREADRRGVALMLAARRDPVAWLTLLQRLSRELSSNAGPSLLSAHPGTGERDAEARAYARSLGWTG
jgi:Zn-dependent protease with chaperone function